MSKRIVKITDNRTKQTKFVKIEGGDIDKHEDALALILKTSLDPATFVASVKAGDVTVEDANAQE